MRVGNSAGDWANFALGGIQSWVDILRAAAGGVSQLALVHAIQIGRQTLLQVDPGPAQPVLREKLGTPGCAWPPD